MASVKTVYECPHCEAPLTSPKRPDKCPACGYSFGEAIMEFKYPLPLSEQMERIQNAPQLYQAILDMPITKANFIMNDALNIIETISAKNVPVSDISSVVMMAIKIGKIASQYHEFLAAGGKHVPSLFITEGEENERSSDRVREDPPRSV